MKFQGKIVAILLMTLCCGTLYTVSYTQQPPPPPQHTMHELAYFRGEPQLVGDGMIYTWVRIDNMNRPTSIGVSFSESALANLPDANTEYAVKWPDVPSCTPFNHFELDWLPRGHYPEQFYGVPHFDFHFYLISPQVREQITGFGADEARDLKQPSAQYIPDGYVPALPAVALMGLHWIRPDFPEFHGHPFTESLIFGSYNGRLAFIEPMMTRTFLLSKPSVDKPVPQPKAVQVSGYYPTRYIIGYDATRHLYTVAFEGLTFRQAR